MEDVDGRFLPRLLWLQGLFHLFHLSTSIDKVACNWEIREWEWEIKLVTVWTPCGQSCFSLEIPQFICANSCSLPQKPFYSFTRSCSAPAHLDWITRANTVGRYQTFSIHSLMLAIVYILGEKKSSWKTYFPSIELGLVLRLFCWNLRCRSDDFIY